MTTLAAPLQPIYELELRIGNEVDFIAEPAGTACPYAVALKRPLHLVEIDRELGLPSTVKYWESRDTHYPIEAGYQCEITRHTIAGPISGK
jgi:hypothetical protein